MRRALLAAALALGACRTPEPDLAARLRPWADRIAEHPRLYPAYLGLAGVYLDEARRTLDPKWLVKARAAAQTSLDIQASEEGLLTMAHIASFSHRFPEAIAWARKLGSEPEGEVTSLLVESYLGLGDLDAARALLPAGAPADFHTAAALGHWLKAKDDRARAAAAFEAASKLALAQRAAPLAAWARVMAAGVYLDAGELDAARPHLAAAAAIDPAHRELRIHQAELLTAEGERDEALARYEALLEEAPDAELHHRAFVLAARNGDTARARAHFRAAEQLLEPAIAGGEGYTLEGLARLYLDAHENDARALELATRNLTFKKDRSARETLAEAQRRAASR